LDSLYAFLPFEKMYKPNLAVELVKIQCLVGRLLHDFVSGRAAHYDDEDGEKK
jgi:hypothetical protein